MTIARRLLVSGRVQGVGFRWFVVEAASVEGITGWVRNVADGSVEVMAEGEAEAMERFERQVRRGPAHARVDDVATDVLVPSGRFATFSARP
jgi:acylphosphatase